jgi:hypothetical protein
MAATYPTIALAQVHAAPAYSPGHIVAIHAAFAEEDRLVEDLKARSGRPQHSGIELSGEPTANWASRGARACS